MTVAEKTKKRMGFWSVLSLCSGIFLALVLIGLVVFWDFIAAYEESNPQSVIARYMETLTPEHICQLDTTTPGLCDRNLQSEERYRTVAVAALREITYAKNTKLSTDDKKVYMLLNGGQTIGSVTMTVVSTDFYGLDYWQVTEEKADLSYLVSKSVTLTVPDDYSIYLDGVLLDSRYVTESGIRYKGLEDYYRKYREMPYRCTYTTKPVLGTPELTITDAFGNAVDPDSLDSLAEFPDNCSDGQRRQLQEFTDSFLYQYVCYTTAAGGQGMLHANYEALLPYVRMDSSLYVRIKDALEGMSWVLDRQASITQLTINRMMHLGDERYMIDLSYVVDGTTQSGAVRNTANVKLIIVDEGNGFQAESMINY